MSTLEKALEIALHAHNGKKDKADLPYILHPIRIMLKMNIKEEMIIAILHDVVEDSSITMNDLKLAGFNKSIISTLDLLSKKKSQSYSNYIKKIASNKKATKIKIADLEDNLILQRINKIDSKDWPRIKKYHWAINYLMKNNR